MLGSILRTRSNTTNSIRPRMIGANGRLLRQSALVTALALSGAAVIAGPVVYNDSFTLATSNQSMWGSGPQQGWNYSTFQGVRWGTYQNTSPYDSHGPETVSVSAIAGSESETIIPSVCVWTPWGTQCTGSVTVDTRTGAAIGMQTSGQLGVGVNASANGGAINVVMPVNTTLKIGEANVNGNFRIGGTATVDTASGGAQISTNAPSFKAGVNGVVNVDFQLDATGCFFLAGCSSSSSQFGFGGDLTVVGVDTGKGKVTALGLDFGIPGVNSYYELRKNPVKEEPVPCVGPITKDGKKPSCGEDSPVEVKGPMLAQVEFEMLKDLKGGNYDPYKNTLSVSNNSSVLHLDADVTGIVQYLKKLPVDILNPKVTLDVGIPGKDLSAEIKMADFQAGLVLGLEQAFSVKPSLQATLQFDKPVSEYVQVLDHTEKRLDHSEYVISFTQSAADKASGCLHTITFDGETIERCSPHSYGFGVKVGGNGELLKDGTSERLDSTMLLLKPNEPFHLDAPYWLKQCRIEDGPQSNPYSYFTGLETSGTQHKVVCYEPAVLSTKNIYVDVPVYRTELVERGTTITVDLDKGADFKWTDGVGNLISRSYTMGDSANFRSSTAISLGLEERFQAGCLVASLLVVSINECVVDQSADVNLASFNVYDRSFDLQGFNTITFDANGGMTDSGPGPGTGPDPTVPEPSSLWLGLLALLGAWGVRTRTNRRTQAA